VHRDGAVVTVDDHIGPSGGGTVRPGGRDSDLGTVPVQLRSEPPTALVIVRDTVIVVELTVGGAVTTGEHVQFERVERTLVAPLDHRTERDDGARANQERCRPVERRGQQHVDGSLVDDAGVPVEPSAGR